MKTQKPAVNHPLIATLLSWVRSGEIAIPEIQRPFVWDNSKVRDLMDSLYKGFPVGYVIAWRNPNVRLKDGSMSEGKKILIDGQQRVTALKAAILGAYVVDKNYQQIKIRIAFHPIEERFEVQNPAIVKDQRWLPDISAYFGGEIAGKVPNYTSHFEIEEKFLILMQKPTYEMAKDKIHEAIKTALKKDGWLISNDPLSIRTGKVLMEIDLAAEKMLIAEKDTFQAVFEVKTFERPSLLYDFHLAMGQYINYRGTLADTGIKSKLVPCHFRNSHEALRQGTLLPKAIERKPCPAFGSRYLDSNYRKMEKLNHYI